MSGFRITCLECALITLQTCCIGFTLRVSDFGTLNAGVRFRDNLPRVLAIFTSQECCFGSAFWGSDFGIRVAGLRDNLECSITTLKKGWKQPHVTHGYSSSPALAPFLPSFEISSSTSVRRAWKLRDLGSGISGLRFKVSTKLSSLQHAAQAGSILIAKPELRDQGSWSQGSRFKGAGIENDSRFEDPPILCLRFSWSLSTLTRWSTTLSLQVNLPHAIYCWAKCSANLVTRWPHAPQSRGQRIPPSPPCGWSSTCIHTQADTRLPGKGNSNFYGARPVHQIISMIKWTRTSRFSIKKSISSTSVRSTGECPSPDIGLGLKG